MRALLALCLAGCTTQVAPVVRSVEQGPDGRVTAETCTLEIKTMGPLVVIGAVSVSYRDCVKRPAP